MVIGNNPKVHPIGTVASLFEELDRLPMVEKKGYIEDWLIHFSPNNPLYEETEDENQILGCLFIKEKSEENWKNLYLVGDSFGWDEPKECFIKIKNTNWWYILFTRPKGTRIHYLLSPNDLGTLITSIDREERRKNWFFDVRNKLNVESLDRVHSLAKFPGFTPSMEPGLEDIELRQIRLPRRLEGNRSIKVGILDPNQPFDKLLLIHDGDTSFKQMKIGNLLKKGVSEGIWPNLAIVSLSIDVTEKIREYGGRPGYPDFIADTVIPSIEEILSVKFLPENITIVGNALGAWAAFDVVWHRSDRIKNVICQSTPWWWPDENNGHFLHLVENHEKVDINKLYFDCGIYETGKKPLSTYDSNLQFAKILTKKNYNFMARELLMGHRHHSWAWSLPGAFNYILRDEIEYGPLPGRKMTEL